MTADFRRHPVHVARTAAAAMGDDARLQREIAVDLEAVAQAELCLPRIHLFA
jgi:hypothetical protein